MNLRPAIQLCVLSILILCTTIVNSQTIQDAKQSYDRANEPKAINSADDAAIDRTLKKLIKESEVLSRLKIEASTQKGVITLKGEVDSDMQASALVEYAESITGVRDIDTSALTVKNSSQPLADTFITAKIKGLLIREKIFGEKDIAAINTVVETKDGVVYLSGHIENQDQINNAIEIIKQNIPEVKKVEYKLIKITPVNSN